MGVLKDKNPTTAPAIALEHRGLNVHDVANAYEPPRRPSEVYRAIREGKLKAYRVGHRGTSRKGAWTLILFKEDLPAEFPE